jgi:hypothetical protein
MSTSRMGWLWVVATAVSLLATVAGQQALEQKQESAPPAAQQAEKNDQKPGRPQYRGFLRDGRQHRAP